MIPALTNPDSITTMNFDVPLLMDKDLRNFLSQIANRASIVDPLLLQLQEEYEGCPSIIENYRPVNTTDEFWNTTKPLMLHMNTTRIAVRSFEGTYSGRQERKVAGNGPHAVELDKFVNGSNYRTAARNNFKHAILYGTQAATPIYDDNQGEYDIVLLDPVRTRIYANPLNVKDTWVITEHEPLHRWIRFISKVGSGYIFNGKVGKIGDGPVYYDPPLPMLPASISYGEDQLSQGKPYGLSLVRETPGYNRILSNAYYAIGLLIKWQSRSLIVIAGGENQKADTMPVKVTQVNGNTALLMDHGGMASFISPNAAFDQILKVIDSYLSFLAVSLGMPKTVFIPQDNMAAQSAKLEGAPLLSSLKALAQRFEEYEKDLILRTAFYMHMRVNKQFKTMAQLKEMYQPLVSIEPWDYTEDPYANANSMVALVNAGIMRIVDAVKDANPALSPQEIDEQVKVAQDKFAAEAQRGITTGNPPPEELAPAA